MSTEPRRPLAFRIARAALRLYPRSFRSEYGAQILEAFASRFERASQSGSVVEKLRLWAWLAVDLARSVPREHLSVNLRLRRKHGRVARPYSFIESILQDVRFGIRLLRRRTLFTSVAVLTLGLGIGATTAMFSVVDGVLLKPLPYNEPDRLVSVWQTMPSWEGTTGPEGRLWDRARLTYSQYKDLSEKSTVYEGLAVYQAGIWDDATLTGVGDPAELRAGAATASLLPLLGVQPLLGRWFLPEEEAFGAGDGASVVVVSHEFWHGRLGGSSEALGRIITIDNRSFTIVGILPPGFRIHWLSTSLAGGGDPGRRDVWFSTGAPGWGAFDRAYAWEAVGRLAPGSTLDQARIETSTIMSAHPDTEGDVRVLPRAGEETHGFASPLVLLFGATALLLVIACGNIATLSLAEVQNRRHEMTTRSALGASAPRIVRLLLSESLVLAVLGSAVGAALAYGGTSFLVALAPPIPRIHEVGVDLRVLGFAVLAGTCAGLVFGTVPAIVSSKSAMTPSLRASGRASAGHRGFSSTVVALQVALTAMILVAGGLLTRSLSRLMAVDPGFDTGQLATVEVSLPRVRYQTREARLAFFQDVLGELERIPGIGTVSAANSLPFPGRTAGWSVHIEGPDPEFVGSPFGYHVAPGYLENLGVPLLVGRRLAETDGADAPPVVVINETMARRYWPDGSPLGAQFRYPGSEEPVTVVGVVGDVKKQYLHETTEPAFFIPFGQNPRDRICFVARTEVDAQSVVPFMRQAVWTVDGELAVTNATTVAGLIAQSADQERYRTLLMNVFGTMAALLAAAGVFGVTARSVALRTREMGIRMALGATGTGLVRTTVRGVLYVGVTGTAVGLLGALWTSRVLSRFLFGIEPSDPTTYGAVTVAIVIVCLLSSYAPARRITRVNPVEVLKAE
ncbi:MAG: ABC transporter permease [Gemmatimonadota bacterium]|nr:MAG: ABC transporter permease [Gemmatimonadota bacterium]